jgi:hypothetical protein
MEQIEDSNIYWNSNIDEEEKKEYHSLQPGILEMAPEKDPEKFNC